MKKLSTYLFLIFFSFQTSSLADDIRDFQIEGMSVGDSLLDFFSEEEIKNNISECYKKQNEITEELSNIFISTKKTKRKKKHRADKSGKSTVTSVFFKFKSGDYVSVECLDWSKKMRFRDHLRVSITLKELSDWLSTENIYK